jgi:hypothetical protein
MSTPTPTPNERLQEAYLRLLMIAGEKGDFLQIVGMRDTEMVHFVQHLSNLLSLTLKMASVTIEASDARAEARAGNVARLRKLMECV